LSSPCAETATIIQRDFQGAGMKCPHCHELIAYALISVSNHTSTHQSPWNFYKQLEDSGFVGAEKWTLQHGQCPACNEPLIGLAIEQKNLTQEEYSRRQDSGKITRQDYQWLYPASSGEVAVEPEVPTSYKDDFLEAYSLVVFSPKASAALSRRLLQKIFRNEFNLRQSNMAKEIEEFINLPDVPSYLKQAIDAVRTVGNFAAHPIKSTSTGEIVEVEPGEAQWLIDVIDAVFDFTFVQPKRLEERKAQLNQKLADAGIRPMIQ
jgi:hypothetical protein